MKPVLAALTIALLSFDGGYAAHRAISRTRSDVRGLFGALTHVGAAPTAVVALLLGVEDCRNAMAFAAVLDGLRPAESLRRLVLVAGPDSIRREVEAVAQNMALDVPVVSITPAQLRALGLRQTHHIGRLIVADRQGQLVMMSPLPSSPREASAAIAVATLAAGRISTP